MIQERFTIGPAEDAELVKRVVDSDQIPMIRGERSLALHVIGAVFLALVFLVFGPLQKLSPTVVPLLVIAGPLAMLGLWVFLGKSKVHGPRENIVAIVDGGLFVHIRRTKLRIPLHDIAGVEVLRSPHISPVNLLIDRLRNDGRIRLTFLDGPSTEFSCVASGIPPARVRDLVLDNLS